LSTSVARLIARTALSASSGSSAPPAIIISSSVPTMRSHCGRIALRLSVTSRDLM